MRRVTAAFAAVTAIALALTGCATSGTGTGSDPNNPNQVEVFTWWSAGTEKQGLDALVGIFEEDHPYIEFINAAVAGSAGDNARKALAFRLEANNPPDTFQAHAGAELDGYIQAGQLQDLSAFYRENKLDEVFPSTLIDQLTVDGKIYSVPSNIHRANVVWANTSVLTAAGIDPAAAPRSMDEWIRDLQKVRDSGVEYPLALATDWTQLQLFENVLIADLGPNTYDGLFRGDVPWDYPAMATVFSHYSQLLDFANPDFASLDWPDATQLVIDGKAAYNVMGDWAEAQFQEVGSVYGDDYTTFATPGTAGMFDFLADSFTLPVGAPHEDAARDWLETLSSEEGQVAFSLAKGSIPARTDIDASAFPAYQQTAIASFATDTVVSSLAHGAAANPAWVSDITEAIAAFGKDRKVGPLQRDLLAAALTQLGTAAPEPASTPSATPAP